MKMSKFAIGAGLGYLAGNEQARQRIVDAVKQLRETPQFQAVEDRLAKKTESLTSSADEVDLRDSQLSDAKAAS